MYLGRLRGRRASVPDWRRAAVLGLLVVDGRAGALALEAQGPGRRGLAVGQPVGLPLPIALLRLGVLGLQGGLLLCCGCRGRIVLLCSQALKASVTDHGVQHYMLSIT